MPPLYDPDHDKPCAPNGNRFEARQRKKEEWELRRRLKNKGKRLPTSKKDKVRKKEHKAKTSKQLKKAALDRAAADRQKRKLG